MAHYRAIIKGSRAEVSRLGTKSSGMWAEVQSWQGKIPVQLWHDSLTATDMAEVRLEPHYGHGTSRTVYRGPVHGGQ